MYNIQDKAIQPGSAVLVTGINGYIASHVADLLMSLGFQVHGTARDNEKVNTIGKTLQQRHPSASFRGFVVDDIARKGAFAEAVKGCAGIIHLASDVSFDPDPNVVVTKTVEAMRNILETAAKSPALKRFVYTSSSIAAVHPVPNERFHVDSSSWNETDLKAAWAPPPYSPERSFAVYGASKVEGEQTGWEFMKNADRDFVLNAVLPNFAVGPLLDSTQHGSTSGWVRGLFNGDKELSERMRTFPPQWNVDVRDVARLHVAALLENDVQNERIFAFAETFNYSRMVDMLKRIDPSREHFPPPLENEGEDLSTVDTARAIELLKRMDRLSFTGLEDSLRDQLA